MSKPAARPYGLFVDDIRVNMTRQGQEFWLTWRMRMESVGRVQPIPGTRVPPGDHVWIRCDDPFGQEFLDLKSEAEQLQTMFIERGMHPKTMRVMRRPAALDDSDVYPASPTITPGPQRENTMSSNNPSSLSPVTRADLRHQRESNGDPGAPIHIVSDQQQLVLPGTLWPAGCDVGQGDPLFFAPVSKREANELLMAFGHPLGPFNRPFGYQAWGLAIDGQAVAVAVSGSTVGARAAGFERREVVDLARIARHPDHPGILRVMLRLWRDYLAPRWDYWPVRAAVSYALPGKAGNLYRFDGWRKAGACKPWTGGGTWSKPSRANQIGDGIKTVYVYEYPATASGARAAEPP